jgi:signal peptidase I
VRFFLFLLAFSAAQGVEINTVLPTGSMLPVFNEHYYLLVDKRSFAALKIGQVIVYRCKPFLINGITYSSVVHAVWRKSSGGKVVLCKGVNNRVPDNQLVTESDYVGTVICWVDKETYYGSAFKMTEEVKKEPANVLEMMNEGERKIFLDGEDKGDQS